MSARSLDEHLGYWQDEVKLAAYTAALNEVITPGARVLDLGAGTGLLGMLAVRAGASKVWSVDSGNILGVARDLAKANGFDDRIEFVLGMSTEIALPEVDIVVCDQIGGLAFDAGVLEYFADAKARALADGGALVPAAFDLFLAPVEAPEPYEQVEGWGEIDGIDLGQVRKLAANTEYRVTPKDLELLSDGKPIGSFASSCTDAIKATCEWTATRSGTIHGLSGWFEATMSPSVTLTNNPTDPGRMNRWLNFYPTEQPIKVEPGDVITGSIDIRPSGYLARWSVGTAHAATQRMSTFAGEFVFDQKSRLGARSGSANQKLERQQVLTELAELSTTGSSVSDLVSAARHSGVFATGDAAARFAKVVHQLLS